MKPNPFGIRGSSPEPRAVEPTELTPVNQRSSRRLRAKQPEFPLPPEPRVCPAVSEPFNAAAQVTPRNCSCVVLRDYLLVEGTEVLQPASDDEENMDTSSSRKRTREDGCDEGKQGPRKTLPTDDYPAKISDDHSDDGSQSSNSATCTQLETSADRYDTSLTASPSVINALVSATPAASQLLEADYTEASAEAEEHGAAQDYVTSAPPKAIAAFLWHSSCIINGNTRKELKKLKKKNDRQYSVEHLAHTLSYACRFCMHYYCTSHCSGRGDNYERGKKGIVFQSLLLEEKGKRVATRSANHHGPTGDSADMEKFRQVFTKAGHCR
ncbi:hypothetical protein HPB51_021892 [Rhipicephalus microplus]|uniref:Uncharacterized protein n=1 Tax=Rhipicephalus microplus TaxID=6941 RepID=A0A9J6EIJ5_RHIMP|nr:hypothetical protein HPB51_021892 [Rhipicephalus microplus]